MAKVINRLLIIFVLQLSFDAYAQLIGPRWEKCFGGSNWDFGESLVFDGKQYLAVGTTNSTDGIFDNNHGAYDMFLIRTDTNGNLIEVHTYGGSLFDGELVDITKINDSVFNIAGITRSVDGDININPWADSWGSFWVLQIDKKGSINWERVLGGSGAEEMKDIITTYDKGTLVYGVTTSQDGDISVNYGSWDIWMIKLNRLGEKQWDFTLGSIGIDYAGSVKQTIDGGYIICGTTGGFGGGNYDTTCNHHSLGYLDVWIVKLDSLRNIQWQQCYGGYFNDGGSNILEVEDGYVVLGTTMSNDGDVSGYHGWPGDTDYGGDIWVFKINWEGNLIWQNSLGGYNGDYARNIFTTTDGGGYMVVGTTSSDDGDVEGYHGIDTGIYDDIWFAKLDSNGQLLWQYCYGGGGYEQLYRGVVQKGDLNYVLNLNTESDPWQCGIGGMYPDLRLVEIGDSLTAINEAYLTKSKMPLFLSPNPASSELTVTIGNHVQGTSLALFNSQGQQVRQIPINDYSKTCEINVEELPAGLYVVVLLDGGQMVAKAKVLISD